MSMYNFVFMLTILVTFMPSRGAAEFLYGEVIEVNRDRQEFVLMVVPAEQRAMEQADKSIRVHVTARAVSLPKGKEARPFLPGCVQVGHKVRVWGESTNADGSIFLAQEVRGCRGKNCSDPTGVRSRLYDRKCRNRPEKRTGAASTNVNAANAMDSDGVDGGGRGARGCGGNGGRSGNGGRGR